MAPSIPHFDVAIIGSGFGGSVMAMRLTQKGYRVAILEMGLRYRPEDFPKTNWNVRRFLWAPLLRCFGFQKMTLLKGLMVLHGVGVGGGSLVYAATLLQPRREVFESPLWPVGRNWAPTLEPFFGLARRMLGVVPNRYLAPTDLALKRVAARMGVEESFEAVDAGIYFGENPEAVADPFFSGDGPSRNGCIFCGGCLVGCRYGAKNSLDYNYLYFAEKWGATVVAETKVDRITPIGDESNPKYRLETRNSTAWFSRRGLTLTADRVVVSAGVLGTLELLLRNKLKYRTLPHISERLGETVRTNGESLLGATSLRGKEDYSKGIAIAASIHPSPTTKIEAVRYPSGSNFMKLLGVPLTADGGWITRPLKLLAQSVLRFRHTVRVAFIRDWASHSVILLVMQSIDQKMRLGLKRGVGALFGSSLSVASDTTVPCYIPEAQKAANLLAEEIEGEPQNVIGEVLFKTPTTAHILGGCCMGTGSNDGVVSATGEVFGHPGLFVSDGSVIPANLGVNPSLTITSLAEFFASTWPEKSIPPAEIAERRVRFSESSVPNRIERKEEL